MGFKDGPAARCSACRERANFRLSEIDLNQLLASACMRPVVQLGEVLGERIGAFLCFIRSSRGVCRKFMGVAGGLKTILGAVGVLWGMQEPLTTSKKIDIWLRADSNQGAALEQPLPDDTLSIVAGEHEDRCRNRMRYKGR